MRPALLALSCCLLWSAPLAAQAPAAPKLSMKRWITTTVNGSADAQGKNMLVVRSRAIVLLSGIAPGKKPVERVLAKPREGSSMGYGWIAPDARHGALMDDTRAMVIARIDGGKNKTLTKRYFISDAQFTPNGDAVLWWRQDAPLDREEYALRPNDAEIVPTCAVYRMELGDETSQPIKTDLPQCRNILSISKDGRYAIIGDGGKAHDLMTYYEHNDTTLPFRTDSYTRFYRVELATGARELLGERELLGVTISDDGRVLCGSEPKNFFSEDEARIVCLRDGKATDYKVPTVKDAKRGWRTLSLSPDGSKLAISLQAGPTQQSLVHVLALKGGTLLRTERMLASTLAWLPGGRRLFVTPDDAHARLYDLEAGWTARVGEPGQEVSGIITLGEQDDRFLVGVERKSTRDMWMVEVAR